MAEATGYPTKFKIGEPAGLVASEMNIPRSIEISKDIEANLNKGRINGKDNEKWASWLVGSVQEFDDI